MDFLVLLFASGPTGFFAEGLSCPLTGRILIFVGSGFVGFEACPIVAFLALRPVTLAHSVLAPAEVEGAGSLGIFEVEGGSLRRIGSSPLFPLPLLRPHLECTRRFYSF